MKKMLIMMVAAAAMLPLAACAATLDEAHAAFAAGKFADSTKGYEAVIDSRGYSAPVLFDLGNSLVREGNLPQAILAYKRALWLAPDDADILANLQTAQRQAGAPVEEPPGYSRYTSALNVNGWAWVGCAAWTLLCASLLLRVVVPAQRKAFAAAGVVCLLALGGAIAAIALASGGLREAVVVGKEPAALQSPFPAAQVMFTPVPGETVKIEKAYNDYLRVADRTGHTGWMARDALAPVVR